MGAGKKLWGYYPTTKTWIPLQVDANGKVVVDLSAVKLDDLADVSVATPTDGYILYWDAATSLWKCKAVTGMAVHGNEYHDPDFATEAAFLAHASRHEYGGADELSGLFTGVAAGPLIYYIEAISSTPRTATVSSVSGDVITLTATQAYRFWHSAMNGNTYLKIANTSKSPVQYAWVKASPATNKLQVTVAADISSWVNTNTISTAEDGASSIYIELDISPSVPATAAFIGVRVGAYDSGTITLTTDNGIAYSPTGASIDQKCQVSSLRNYIWGIIPITGQKCYAFDRAAGINTHYSQAQISAFIT
jgi:hypothetical protein